MSGIILTGVNNNGSGGGTVTGANEGLSVDSGNVQLGNELGSGLTTSQLTTDRIVLCGSTNIIKWAWQLNDQNINLFMNDTPGALVLENDFLNSGVPAPEAYYKIRTNPSATPPFDGSFENFFGLANTGATFIRARDLQNPPIGGNDIVLQFQNFTTGVRDGATLTTTCKFIVWGDGVIPPELIIDNGGGSSRIRLNQATDPTDPSALVLDNTGGDGDIILDNGHGSIFRLNSDGSGCKIEDGGLSLIDAVNLNGAMLQLNSGFGTAMLRLRKTTDPVPNTDALLLDNVDNGGEIQMDNGSGAIFRLLVSGDGVEISNGAYKSADPGAGAGQWKLGKLQVGAVVLDNTRYIELDVDGTVFKMLVGT
jgi:hypothetical protein